MLTKNKLLYFFTSLVFLTLNTSCQSSLMAPSQNRKIANEKFDVLIVGGSHAGLSAAITLGRLRRSVLIVDAGNPRNKQAKAAYNIAGFDGLNPNTIREIGRKDLIKYDTVRFIKNRVSDVKKAGNQFKATLESGETVSSRKVILAYGVKDKLPEADGFWKLWGKAVFHCPFCHGYEARDKIIGIVGGAKFVTHMAPILTTLSQKTLVFIDDKNKLSNEFLLKLDKNNIDIYDSEILKLNHDGKKLKSVELKTGEKIKAEALLVSTTSPPIEMKANICHKLNCSKDNAGRISVNRFGETSIAGVFAAGDIISPAQSIVQAMASGQTAGAGAVFSLAEEDFNKRK